VDCQTQRKAYKNTRIEGWKIALGPLLSRESESSRDSPRERILFSNGRVSLFQLYYDGDNWRASRVRNMGA